LNNLAKLGFDNWFEDKFELSKTADFWKSSIRSPSDIPSGKIVRVISVNKNSYVVSNGEKDIYVELTGKFLFNSDSALV